METGIQPVYVGHVQHVLRAKLAPPLPRARVYYSDVQIWALVDDSAVFDSHGIDSLRLLTANLMEMSSEVHMADSLVILHANLLQV